MLKPGSLRAHLTRELDWLSETIEVNAGGGVHAVLPAAA